MEVGVKGVLCYRAKVDTRTAIVERARSTPPRRRSTTCLQWRMLNGSKMKSTAKGFLCSVYCSQSVCRSRFCIVQFCQARRLNSQLRPLLPVTIYRRTNRRGVGSPAGDLSHGASGEIAAPQPLHHSYRPKTELNTLTKREVLRKKGWHH